MLRVVVGASSFAASSSAPLDMLRDHGVDVTLNPYGRKWTEAESMAMLREADGLLAGLEPLNRRVLESCKGRLKAIARIGIGMDNVDQDAARELGVAVSNTPAAPAEAVAEMTLTALLALIRGLVPADRALHARRWEKRNGFSLRELSVLVVGYGRSGKATADLLRLLGADVLIHDPFVPGHSLPSLEQGLALADVVSLHASGNVEVIGKKELAVMKKGAFLLNPARGGLVDEEALADALLSGALAGAWQDAHSEEPYSGMLCDVETMLLTPHMATYTARCRKAMESEAVRNILRDLRVPGCGI